MKALLQRRHSPDLYDFVHAVFFQKTLNVSRREVLSTFLKQTIYEPEPMIARNLLLELPFQAIKELWNEYLVCPKSSLFNFDDAEGWFKTVVGEIFSLVEPRFAYANHGRIATREEVNIDSLADRLEAHAREADPQWVSIRYISAWARKP